MDSYILKTDEGNWLGQVVLTEDGMFSSVTDWGNFSYSWPNIGDRPFKEFLLQLDVQYFGQKMYTGMSYIASSRAVEAACHRFAKNILPALQKVLKEEKIKEKTIDIQPLLNSINKVTAPHRHGQTVPKRDLDKLCNNQIDFEEAVKNSSKRNLQVRTITEDIFPVAFFPKRSELL